MYFFGLLFNTLNTFFQGWHQMNTIKKVSLEGTFAGKIDQASLLTACPQVRELNLSKTLIGSWVDVAKVGRGLPNLKSLRLDNDRVGPRLEVRFTQN